ncbi:zinc finger AN1 and C2H2 domain-containing stress-associated protein 11-like [Cyclospora cayetanensis]|uniref:Zinc finger AN1 and C2H2 domain-containing stress-associated protein 11-like n=1 Tax=Cyclospora cayetanensis TaxID=88456 RepID=A0A6P6RUX6_9EIME|nr:zinc finger AN1 and C2H2 domain-containing stress-associated protein 11-like [Cyclospora cayetanensis]
MAVLSDKGLICSNSLCRQRDFLPFRCEKCENVFCLEHYLPDDHSCPKKNIGNRRVYVCPECQDVIRLMDLETDEDGARRHRNECKPELRAQREQMRKGRHCPVKGCKERLTAVSSIRCPHCQMDVCIRHRLKEDHNCEILKAQHKERRRSSLLRQTSSNAMKAVKTLLHPAPPTSGGPSTYLNVWSIRKRLPLSPVT